MLVLPYPLWALLRLALDATNHENRPLEPFPTFAEYGLNEMPARLEAYLADHAPFRNQFMSLNAGINWHVFRTIDSETVLAGKDGWLFYKNASDSAPLDDYQGTNLYTDEQMQVILGTLLDLEETLAAQNCRLAVVIAPSKELVYRRYMPNSVPMVHPQGRIGTLAAYLAENSSLAMLWPEEELRALSETQPVYFKYDTHWNEAGAAYTCALLLETLGLHGPAPASLAYGPSPEPPLRDLAALSATWDIFQKDASYTAAWPGREEAKQVFSDEFGYHTTYFCPGAPNAGKLLVFRDSFGENMEPFLASSFAESSFVHINAFGEDTLRNEHPTLFVIEITQRYADRLLDYLPRLAAWAKTN